MSGTNALYYVDGSGALSSTALSLALVAPSEFSVSGSPITSPTGTFTLTKASQVANAVWIGPASGGPAAPTFRTLALADLAPLGLTNNQLITGVTAGAPVAASLVAGTNIMITYGSGTITIATTAAVGTVTSVGLALPASVFSVSGSPVTGSGTLTGSFVTQSANRIFAGPSSGGAATPTFRAMTYADLPPLADGQLYIGFTGGAPVAAQLTAGTLITITPGMGTSTVATTALGMVTLSMPVIFSVGSSSGPNTQTLTVSLATETANTVWAGPTSGGAATPTFRSLVAADIPSHDTSKLTTGVLPVARGGTNSGSALNNNRIMVSSGGAIVEAAALTNGQLLIGSTGAAPVAASLTAGTAMTITPGAGSITLAVNTAALPNMAEAMGEISSFVASGPSLTTISATSDGTTNMVEVNASMTTLAANAMHFDMPSAGRLRYTGTNPVACHCATTLTLASSGSNQQYVVGMALNGTIQTRSKVLQNTQGSGDTQSTALHGYLPMTTNTYLSLFVGNLKSTNSFQVFSANYFCMCMTT